MASTPKETTTKVEPWSGAKPYLLDTYAQFDQLLKDGAPKPYQGSTVANQSQATKDALNQAEQIARSGNTAVLGNATNAVNSVLNQSGNTQANQTLSQLQNGVNVGTNPTNNFATNVMNGGASNAPGSYNLNYANPALQGASGLGSYTNNAAGLQAGQANQLANSANPAASDYLKQTASGANVGNNPWLQQNIANQQSSIIEQLKNVTTPGIDSQAAALGRMGSGAYASQRNNADATASKAMAEVATNALTQQYSQDIANQQNAANLYSNMYSQDVANRLNANQQLAATDAQQQQIRQAGTSLYGDLANSQEAMRQNAASGANSQFNANNAYQMQGAQMAGNSYQSNIANMLGVNDQRMNAANSALSAQNALNGQKLSAAGQAGQAYQNQYLPSQALAGVGADRDAYADLVKQAEVNAWDRAQQQPLQNLANFTNILNGGGYNSTTTPVYTNGLAQGIGAIGSLAGLFALCSAKVKTIHSFVGVMPLTNGGVINIYKFSYTDDPEHVFVGPIAEEVAEELPEAVVELGGIAHIDVAAFMQEAA